MHPLTGVRILDFTRVLAGPFCTMNLADMGADVIKVESVDGGDDTRAWGPPFVGGESAYYLCTNRNKRSIAIDLKSSEGQQIVQELIKQSDVIIHNFLPQSVSKLQLTYEEICLVKPDIIYCSISGYGCDDSTPGYDYIMQAIGGLMSITGEQEGPSMKVGVAITDLFTGLYASIAIEAALLHKEKTGYGQQIDMALYDAQIAMLANVASNVLVGGKDAKRFGNEHPNIVPYQSFETSDGEVVITVGNDLQFRSFCQCFDLEALANDPSYATNAKRVENRNQLIQILQRHLKQYTTGEVLQKVTAVKVPCGSVRTVSEALHAQETGKRNMLWDVHHPLLGDLKLVGSPLKLSRTPPLNCLPPPLHGEHTVEILHELGIDDLQIKEWIGRGVIGSC